jgi:hypothetical protein
VTEPEGIAFEVCRNCAIEYRRAEVRESIKVRLWGREGRAA